MRNEGGRMHEKKGLKKWRRRNGMEEVKNLEGEQKEEGK